MARRRHKQTSRTRMDIVTLGLGLISLVVLVFVFIYNLKSPTIGVASSGELIILADTNYRQGGVVHLCYRPACLSEGRYSFLRKIPDGEKERKLLRVIEEHYFQKLPPVVWYKTKYNNAFGWVPQHFTNRRRPFVRRRLVIRTNRHGARLCPHVECLPGEEITRIPNGNTMTATQIVYRHYQVGQRANAWLRVDHDDREGWININETDLNTPGPHLHRPAWE